MEKQVTSAVSISTQNNLPQIRKDLSLILAKLRAAGELAVADVYDDPITSEGFTQCINRLSVNFGINFAGEQKEKIVLLFEEMLADGWTNERMKQETRYFIRNNKFPTWTVADWFALPISKIYTYSKYLSELHEKGRALNDEIEWYIIGDQKVWAYKKDGALPFEKYKTPVAKVIAPEPEIPNEPFDFNEFAQEFQKRPVSEERIRGVKPLTELL